MGAVELDELDHPATISLARRPVRNLDSLRLNLGRDLSHLGGVGYLPSDERDVVDIAGLDSSRWWCSSIRR